MKAILPLLLMQIMVVFGLVETAHGLVIQQLELTKRQQLTWSCWVAYRRVIGGGGLERAMINFGQQPFPLRRT